MDGPASNRRSARTGKKELGDRVGPSTGDGCAIRELSDGSADRSLPLTARLAVVRWMGKFALLWASGEFLEKSWELVGGSVGRELKERTSFGFEP